MTISPISIENAEILLRLCRYPSLSVGRGVPPHGSPDEVLVELASGVALTDENGAWDDPNMASLVVLAVALLPSMLAFWRKMHPLEPLADEMARARRKFPGNTALFEALGEEFGELAREFEDWSKVVILNDEAVTFEARQVACVAERLAQEGTDMPSMHVIEAAKQIERLCRMVLAARAAS